MKIYLMVNKNKQCGTLQTDQNIEEIKTYYEFDQIYEQEDLKERHEMVILCDLEEVGADFFFK